MRTTILVLLLALVWTTVSATTLIHLIDLENDHDDNDNTLIQHNNVEQDNIEPLYSSSRHYYGDQTLYDIIKSDDRFSTLAKYVDDDEVLKDALNKKDISVTLFAPVNEAFEHLGKHVPPKEYIRKLALYHTVPEQLTAKEIKKSRVLDSSLNVVQLGDKPQKLRVGTFFRKIFINHAKVIDIDIKASNGIAHAINKVLFPPFDILTKVFLFPNAFSTLTSALQKVGIADDVKDSKAITVFAPTNRAFARLGTRTLFYLFSPWGTKYLKRILLYHVSPELVYTSDLIKEDGAERISGGRPKRGHFELDSLEGNKIYLDTVQYGERYLRIKINGGTRVLFSDVIGKNGVAHVIDKVLIPSDFTLPSMNELDDFIVEPEELFQ